MVPILGAPVAQMVEQLPNLAQFFDTLVPDPEQVIEVPKILLDDVPTRTLAEQLVEVPTIVSSSLLQRTMEQNVDIPVPGLEGRFAGLPGFPPAQSSTAPAAQIVDIPVSGGGLQGFRPGHGSSSSHFPAGVGFSPGQKNAASAASPSPRVHASVSSSTPAAQLEDALVPDSIEWVQLRDGDAGKTYFWNRRTRATVWKSPPGVKVVWFGERTEEGGSWYWHRVPVSDM